MKAAIETIALDIVLMLDLLEIKKGGLGKCARWDS
jgi:hypothetical protein